MITLHQAITTFSNADDRWQRELVRVYGPEACNARYDRRGRASHELNRLYIAREEAHATYEAVSSTIYLWKRAAAA